MYLLSEGHQARRQLNWIKGGGGKDVEVMPRAGGVYMSYIYFNR